MATATQQIGKIVQIIGPVVDVSFEDENATLPNILDALEIDLPNGNVLVMECQQHIGEDTVRAISMEANYVQRGMEITKSAATAPSRSRLRSESEPRA